MLLAYGAGILFIGFVLLLGSLRLRHQGMGMRCRSCDYDLEGINTDDARCPECGTRLNARTIVNTNRADFLHRARPIFRILGVLAVCSGIALLLGALYSWPGRYERTPTWFLLSVDLPAAVGTENQLLMDELIRRRISGELSDTDAVSAGKIIIDGTSEITPKQYLSGTGSFGNHFLHPLIETKLITSSHLARSNSMAGQIRIKVSPFIKGGRLNTSIYWKTNYLYGLSQIDGMPQISLERTALLIDGEPLEGESKVRPYGKHEAINHIQTERFLALTNDDVPPGERTITFRGNVLWFDTSGKDATIAARTPFEEIITVTIPREDLPDIEFLNDREYADTVTEALEKHSYVTTSGSATLLVEEPLDEDVVLMFDVQTKVAENWEKSYWARVTGGTEMVFVPGENAPVNTTVLWNITLPKNLDLTNATSVRIRLIPDFNKRSWYHNNHSPDQRFLDEVIELDLPVRNSRSR